MTDKSDIDKLQILLTHWIDHNHSHEAEMDKWRKIAEEGGKEEAAAQIQKAIAAMKETDSALTKALESLGGHPTEHHHHH